LTFNFKGVEYNNRRFLKLTRPASADRREALNKGDTMTNWNGNKERRRYPRVKTKLDGMVHREADASEKLKIKTIDISANGVYCSTNKDLPLFDRLKITLRIPIKNKNKENIKEIHCRGVIVRKEKIVESKNDYHIAIFFDDIEEKTRAILKKFSEQNHHLC
jgi:c-di-GMP-binding flagellar brake protein YcgR